ncbi:GNAT family N-acetyltransferase [Parabacteroides pacaensis]|uniref:GNAT family N-acetyltransferase n=1 Tax=Parabacteroides pacaensis TaxID=2086575 RepID=UPI000D0F665C|nr:GNAT family N-acetyltransferase [Parabacteroides pacaensis]
MQHNNSIREYLPTDKDAVMNLIKLNTPDFFAEEEADDLNKYLDKEIELYYVLLVAGKIVGCGGINFAENKTIGKISWDIIHPNFQGKSLGSKLLKYRIEVLRAIPSVQKITVRTSQVAYKFYEKHGFILNEIKKDYWAKGFDMYYMKYEGI